MITGETREAIAVPPWRALARAWFSSLSGQAIQLALQTVSFVLLARFLGPRDFGWRVGLGAVAVLAGPVVGLGFSNLLIRNVAREPRTFGESWGNALLVTAASGVGVSLACVPLGRHVLGCTEPVPVLAAVFLSDVALARLVAVVGAAFQARGDVGGMARSGTALQAARLAAVAVCLVASPTARFAWWAITTAIGSGVAVGLTVAVARRRLGRPAVSVGRIRREWREGLPFVLSPYTQVVNSDADKIVLGQFAAPQAVAAYGAACRILAVALAPLLSLLMVTYPMFFQHGTRGLGASRRFAGRLASGAIGAGVASTVAVLLLSPLAAKVLGEGFEDAGRILAWLCLVPTLKAIQFLFADALTGAGFQALRVRLQGGVAATNVLMNLALVPRLGWAGAVATSLTCEVTLALALAAGVGLLLRKS